jgi:ribosomal protein S18 acetylase RimI-like enzyme
MGGVIPMKYLKINFLAVLMAFAAMPAWGMYLSSVIAEKVPLVAKSYMFTAKPENGFIPFKETYDYEVRRVFRNSFGFVPALYSELPRFSEIYVWKQNNRVEGVLMFKKLHSTLTQVEYIGVDQNTQRSGVGTRMLNALEKKLAATCPSSSYCAIKLHPSSTAVGFYEKNGFQCDKNRSCFKAFASTMKDLDRERAYEKSKN